MRLLRTLLILLGIAVVCLALLVGAVCTSVVQTWIARWELAKQPGLHASVGSVSVGFSGIQALDLRVERNGVVLTVPDLEAQLPMKTALRDHRLLVSRLVAKGWTLDLSQRLGLAANSSPETTAHPAPDATAVAATAREPKSNGSSIGSATSVNPAAFQGLLRGLSLPYDGSIDGIQVEGDILVATPKYGDASGIHVAAKGDGLAAGRTANFAIDAIATVANTSYPSVGAHGRLTVDVAATHAVNRADFKGTVSPLGTSDVLDVVGSLAAIGHDGDESYALEVRRSDQRYAKAVAAFHPGRPRLEGTWKIDFGEEELRAWVPDYLVHLTAIEGAGQFDTDPQFAEPHLTGKLLAIGTNQGLLAAPPAGPQSVNLRAEFDATHRDGKLRIDRLKVGVRDENASSDSDPDAAPLTLALLQPFMIDESTKAVNATNQDAEWLRVVLRKFPLTWVPPFSEQVRFGHGETTADLTVRGASGAYQLRSKGLLVANGVELLQSGRTLAQHLDLSVPVAVDRVPGQGWTLKASPLAIDRGGRRLITIDGTLPLRPDPYGRMQASGTLKADLDAIAATPNGIAGLGWIKGKSASGSFSANLGAGSDVTAKITVVGHDPKHSVTADLSASIDDYRAAKFQAPVTISTGATTAKLSIDGTWASEPAGQHLEIQVGGEKIGIDQLRLLGGALMPGELNVPAPTARDTRPFWGDLIGRVRVDFREVAVGDREWDNVGATIAFDHRSILLNGVRGVYNPITTEKVDPRHANEKEVEPRSALTAEATITFDPAANAPYLLKGTGSMEDMNATRLLGTPPADQNPEIEGRFAVAATFSGSGKNLADLAVHQREELKLTSHAGIVRLLKTSVAESIPEEKSRPGADAVAGVGYAFGAILGVHPGPKNNASVSPTMEAVLNATYDIAEIGYDQFSVTATRRGDGTIDLSDLAITSDHARITGRGEIAAGQGGPIATRPLSLDLRLGFRGITAERLAKAAVVAAAKDAQGYSPLPQPIHFGGTLNHIDNTAWHDLLVKAAESGKK